MPEPILGTLFIPMVIMTIMQILVFFAQGSQIMKMACVLLIFLAMISFLQVFRATIPVYPETSLGDKIIYASLLMTVFTAIDSFLDMGNSDSTFVLILRIVLLVAASLFPLKVYIETVMYYLMYLKFLPNIRGDPMQ